MGFVEDIVGAGASLGIVAAVIIIGVILVVVGVWWWVNYKQYPIKVELFSHYAGAPEPYGETRAGLFFIDGKRYYKIKKDKNVLLDADKYGYVLKNGKMKLWQSAAGEYHAMAILTAIKQPDGSLKEVDPTMTAIIDPAYSNAYADSLKYAQDRFAFISKWQQYYPVIAIAIIFVLSLMMLWVVGGQALEAQKVGREAQMAGLTAAEINQNVSIRLQQILSENPQGVTIVQRPPA